MIYRHIAITAKIAPLEVVLSEAHALAVQKESQMALAAPALFDAAKSALNALEVLKDGKSVDLDLIRRDLRTAMEIAGEEF